jgi:signal transduction histidine kinase
MLPAVALMLAAVGFGYVRAARDVERLLEGEASARASGAARQVERGVQVYGTHLLRLASSPALAEYARQPASDAGREPPAEVKAAATSRLGDGRGPLVALTCLDPAGRPLFRASNDAAGGDAGVRFQTRDFVTSTIRFDESALRLARPDVLRSRVTQEPYGTLRLTAPVLPAEGGDGPHGALVAELRLATLFALSDGDAGERTSAAELAPRALLAVNTDTSVVIYHTDASQMSQQVALVMPQFARVAGRMSAETEGADSYEARDGDRWVVAFRRVDGLNVSAAAAEDYTRAAAGVRFAGRLGLLLALAAGLAAVAFVAVISTRASRRIGRVAEGAAAVARGELGEHVPVEATGETRVLAESFNMMTERLREHIRHEAEMRQFESFMRLSAMLTHDLKNAITGLSMLVSNMEKYSDRAEFRADAVASLREATDKLKRVVARLNEPVKSLSGEYRSDARPTDLVPVIRRVLAMNAFPSSGFYEVEERLPDALVATVEPERIENVLENLVINALEAMGARGGRLTVEAGQLEGGLVYFSVADTGAGMSEDFVKTRLFRPFTTTKTKGIGLGLFTCREIVEAHGGRLEVESQPGAGTRFRAVLPSALFTQRARRKSSEGAAPASSG